MVYRHDNRPVLQLYRLPLVKLGSGVDGAQRHPQSRPHHRAVVQRQVVAQVPRQVVPKTPMEHDLVGEQTGRVTLFLSSVIS